MSSAEQEPVGSLAEEAMKLLQALGTRSATGGATDDASDDVAAGDAAAGDAHTCPHGWCPVCRLVDHVQNNPEAMDQVVQTAATALRSVRDLLDQLAAPREDRR